jgi:hypothetical protein
MIQELLDRLGDFFFHLFNRSPDLLNDPLDVLPVLARLGGQRLVRHRLERLCQTAVLAKTITIEALHVWAGCRQQ